MKLFILAALVACTLATSPVPTALGALSTAKCNSVRNTSGGTYTAATNTQCATCLQWDSASMAYSGSAAANNCNTTLSTGAITNCKYYNGVHTNTAASTTVPVFNACIKCSKSYWNWTQATTTTTISATCDSSKGTGCTGTISNCLQTNCYSRYQSNSVATVYSSQYCAYCNDGYQPASLDIWDMGALKCVSGTTLSPNCKSLKAATAPNVSPTCTACHKNFAVAGGGGSCIGFTSDDNCLYTASHANDIGCSQCWNAYYFNVSTCTLNAKVLAGFAMMLAALVWFN